ncbi:pentatricopeptide repeat-containing protein [Salix suchowensis]|nr:pentatricopeptide repeat-containing protein [Salix suchowensis]
MIKRRPFHHSIYFKSKKRAITSTCAVPLDPQPTSNDHTSLFQSRVHDLLRRGLLSSAQQAIQRFIASSPTVPDAVFAIEFAAASGVDLGLGISCEILRKLVDLGEPLSAHDFYHDHLIARGIEPDSNIVNSMVICLAKLGKLDDAVKLFDRLIGSEDCVLSNAACTMILEGFYEQDKFLEAFDYFVRISDANVKLGMWIYNVLINGLCHQGYVGEAIQVFDIRCKNTGLPPTLHVFRTLFFGLCKKGWLVEAELVFEEMEVQGFFVDKVMYTSLMNAHGKNKKMKMAMRVYFRMLKKGCDPDIITYNTLIHGFLKMGLFDKAWVLWNLMSDLGIQPNKKGWLVEAELVFEEMEVQGFFVEKVMYTSLMKAHGKNKKMKMAMRVYFRMLKKGCDPDISTYNTLIHGFLKMGLFDKAWVLWNLMSDLGIQPNEVTYNLMICYYCKQGKLDCATMLLNSMVPCNLAPCVRSYTPIIAALYKQNRCLEVDEMCERMLESGIIPDHVLFFVLMKNEPKGLELQLCLLMLQAIAKNGCGLDHSSLSNFDKINSSAGLEQEIELILREITRIDLNLCNVAGSIYVSALCEGGKTEAALACFKNVASAGCIPLLFTFNSLIKRLFQDGRFEDVKSLFEIMQNEGIVPNLQTYLIMVKEYCKQEDLASAFGILDQMKEMGPKPNVAIYACIIACLSKQRRISEAETVFHKMHRDGLDHDEVAYMTMIKAYTRNGRGDKALNLFEKMIENAIQPSSYSYTALLSGIYAQPLPLHIIKFGFCWKTTSLFAQLVRLAKHACKINHEHIFLPYTDINYIAHL